MTDKINIVLALALRTLAEADAAQIPAPEVMTFILENGLTHEQIEMLVTERRTDPGAVATCLKLNRMSREVPTNEA